MKPDPMVSCDDISFEHELTWRQRAMFCLHPKEVDTARGERPRGANSWVKVLARVILDNIIFVPLLK